MKLKWKEDAVSPVIATILMVAITVVLAAVLYVMVIGMGGDTLVQAPVGSWQSMEPLSNNSAKIVFGTISPTVKPMDIKLIIEDENQNRFDVWWSSSTIASQNISINSGNLSISAQYHDTNPSGGQIGSGDYIEFYGLESHTFYYITVFHYASDSVIQMAGDTSFQTVV